MTQDGVSTTRRPSWNRRRSRRKRSLSDGAPVSLGLERSRVALKRARPIQDRIGDRGQMRVDPLEVPDDVQMKRAGFDARGLAGAQALQMPLGAPKLHLAKLLLPRQKLGRGLQFLIDEHGQRKTHRLHQPGMHLLQLPKSFFGELQLLSDLLGGELHQVLVDDVADMLEIGGEGDDVDGPLAVLVVQLAARQPGQIELDRLMQGVDDIVRRFDFLPQNVVVVLENAKRVGEHLLDGVADAQRLPCGHGDGDARRVQQRLVQMPRPLLLPGRFLRVRQKAFDQSRHRTDEGDEAEAERQVEQQMSVDDQAGRGRRRRPGDAA